MTTLEKLEWAYHTVKEQLKFGLPEEEAIKRREARIRGVLKDAIKEVRELEQENQILREEYGQLLEDKIKTIK